MLPHFSLSELGTFRIFCVPAEEILITSPRHKTMTKKKDYSEMIFFFFFFLRDFIFKKTLFEKLQYLKQEQ